MWSTESLYGSQEPPAPESGTRFLETSFVKRAALVDGTCPESGRACLTLPQSLWNEREIRDLTELPKATRIGLENKGIYGWWRTTSASPCPGAMTYYHPQRNLEEYGKKLKDVSQFEKARHELETLGYNDHAKVAELLRQQEKLRGQENRCYCDGHQGAVVLNNQLTVSWNELQKPLLLATSLFRLAAEQSSSLELLASAQKLKEVLKSSRLSWCIFQFHSNHWHPQEQWKEEHPVQYSWIERLLGTHVVPVIGGTRDTLYSGASKYQGNPLHPDDPFAMYFRIPYPKIHAQVNPTRVGDFLKAAVTVGLPCVLKNVSEWFTPINKTEVDDKPTRKKKLSLIEKERGAKTARELLKEYAKKNLETRNSRKGKGGLKDVKQWRKLHNMPDEPKVNDTRVNVDFVVQPTPAEAPSVPKAGRSSTELQPAAKNRNSLGVPSFEKGSENGAFGKPGQHKTVSRREQFFASETVAEIPRTARAGDGLAALKEPIDTSPRRDVDRRQYHVISSSTSSDDSGVFREDLGKRRFVFEGWRRKPKIGLGSSEDPSTTTDTSSLTSDRNPNKRVVDGSEDPNPEKNGFLSSIQRLMRFLLHGDDETIWMPKEYVMDDESRLRYQELEAAMRRKEKEILQRNFGLKQTLVFTLSDFLETIMPCFPESVLGVQLRSVLRQNCGLEERPVDATLEDELKRSVAYNLIKESTMEPNALSDILGYNVGRFVGVSSIQDELVRVAPNPVSVEPAGCTVLDLLDPLKSQVKRRIEDFRANCATRNGAAWGGLDLLERNANAEATNSFTDLCDRDECDELTPWWLSDNPERREEVRTELSEVMREYKSINKQIEKHRSEQEFRHARPLTCLLENPERTPRMTPCWADSVFDPNRQPGEPSNILNTFGNTCQIVDYRRVGDAQRINMYDDGLGEASLFLNNSMKDRRFSDIPLFEQRLASSGLSFDSNF